MLSATFTGMVTPHYEEAFVSLPLLVYFMPMLMDTAGNCGNQISTLMVRGLALGEVEPRDFLQVLGTELRVSAIVGAVLGIVNGLRIYLMDTFLFPGQYANVMGYAIEMCIRDSCQGDHPALEEHLAGECFFVMHGLLHFITLFARHLSLIHILEAWYRLFDVLYQNGIRDALCAAYRPIFTAVCDIWLHLTPDCLLYTSRCV